MEFTAAHANGISMVNVKVALKMMLLRGVWYGPVALNIITQPALIVRSQIISLTAKSSLKLL